MKKILFSLMSFILCGFMAQGQNWGRIYGQVVDSNQVPVQGVSVFVYGTMNTFVANGQDMSVFERNDYTNGNGQYFSSYNNAAIGDSVVVGVIDCNMNLIWDVAVVNQQNDTLIIDIQISCAPGACDAVLYKRAGSPSWPYDEYTATSLRDSSFVINALGGPVTHDWTYSGITRTSSVTFMGANRDTIWIPGRINPNNVCYQRTSSCAPICTNNPTPPRLSCNAHFFVDSVNSINFNGQVVVWENSTTDSGATIVGYRWDFGDGSPTVNQQYPTHTYNDTNVYQVCLTIVSVKQTATGLDTCTSTYCDSIGFDSNGNLVYKSSGQGFTINVVDPATVSQDEFNLESAFSVYPNPTSDHATLSWKQEVVVKQVDVMNISGQLVRSINPSSNSLRVNGLETGVYILRIQSEQGETAVRLMVQ